MDPTFSHIFLPFYKQHSRNFENLSENSIIRTDDMCFNSFCGISNLHFLVILNMHLLIICKKKYTFSFSMQGTLYLDDENIFYVNNRESGLNKTWRFYHKHTRVKYLENKIIWNTIITTGHVYDNVTTRKLWNKNIK